MEVVVLRIVILGVAVLRVVGGSRLRIEETLEVRLRRVQRRRSVGGL